MTEEKIKKIKLYYHSEPFTIPGKKGNYRITFSGRLTSDHDLIIGHSLCCPLDNFVKEKGRARATGRSYSYTEWIASIDLFDEYRSVTNDYKKALHLYFIDECNKIMNSIQNNKKSIINILFPHE